MLKAAFYSYGDEPTIDYIDVYFPERKDLEQYYSSKKNDLTEEIFGAFDLRVDFCGLVPRLSMRECDDILRNETVEVIKTKNQDVYYKVNDYLALYFDDLEMPDRPGEFTLIGGRFVAPDNMWWTFRRNMQAE